MTLAEFYGARLDEDEARARDHLCINCGGHTVPIRSAIGITGYTHDGRMSNGQWEYGWQGKRCQSRLTSAEPVQNPDRALREVAAGRKLLAAWQKAEAERPHDDAEYAHGYDDATADALLLAVKISAEPHAAHPDYDEARRT